MTKRRKQQRRNRRNNKGPAYKCIGVVVKNPNAQNPLRNGTFGDIFGAFAKTLPKYSFESLMALKKSAILEVASKEGVKVWKCWNKTKLVNAILDK